MRKRNSLLILITIAVTFFAVVIYTYGATTIGLNINTGGTLTVSGVASTTLFSSYGPSYFGATATSSFSSAGVLSLISPLAVTSGGTGWAAIQSSYIPFGAGTSAFATSTGLYFTTADARLTATYASTTALSATNINATTIVTTGNLGAGTSTPATEISALGTGTTTLYLSSSSKGGCIELTAANGTTILSLYATTAGTPAIWQTGACK